MIIREITALANMDGFGLPSPISGVLFGGEDQAHKFIIRREDGTAFAGTVTAKFLRYADDVTVPLTGSIEDGAATVTLIENCYMRPGRFKLTMYVTESGSTTAIYCCMGTVDRTDGQQTIDPSGEINLDVTDLINRINTATASVPADYTALLATIAPTFSASTAYTAGQYVWYNGTLYRFTADHAAGTWTGTDAAAAVVGQDVSELKSALDSVLFPLELVAMYDNKILRKTGMEDNNGHAVYQYKIPMNCQEVYIKTNFYGNVFIVFTDMATNGDFSSSPVQFYPSRGYPTPTDVDNDYETKGFSYVWIPLYKASNVTVSAKASLVDIVGDISVNSIFANNTTGGLTDFNDAKRNHIYVISSGISNISHYPPVPNGGTLFCFAAYDIDNVQLFVSNQSAMFFRRKWVTTWGDWKQIPTIDAIETLIETEVNTAFNGYYPFNILSAFKNITCIGDSLTYSQVYTGASTSRQAYKPYPQVLAEKAGATATILATPGDSSTDSWGHVASSIVEKEAQLTVVYLGTNAGLTDTIDTDCVGDDYTQWANTNTGNYAKIIAKSISVGSRVVLVKVHSSTGDVTTTNTVIEKMATKFNVPFIGNTYLSGTKYHSYPDGTGTNGTHYNDFGYAVFADQVANSISNLSASDAVKIIPV